jgi:UDP-N-acetylmuramate dehydrogenase
MRELPDVPLSTLTSLRVGGPAERLLEAFTTDELVDAVRGEGRDGCLVIGMGSNLVVGDAGVDVPVVAVRTSGVEVRRTGSDVLLEVAAGEIWDDLVARGVAEGWTGVEALSGIPGSVGATPIQNVGAYGQEIAEVVVGVEVYDRLTARRRRMSRTDCAFTYRGSVFKSEPDRLVVLAVHLRLRVDDEGAPVRYAELAGTLGVELGGRAPLSAVREAVLDLRRRKGMLLDAADHDTWSAGSFFTNPVLPASEVPDAAPRWEQPDGRVKTSAAWLIEQAGFGKGFGAELGTGRATLSTKHTLAVTNRGQATTEDVLLLARTVRSGVRQRFGVTLHPEPTLFGVHL